MKLAVAVKAATAEPFVKMAVVGSSSNSSSSNNFCEVGSSSNKQ